MFVGVGIYQFETTATRMILADNIKNNVYKTIQLKVYVIICFQLG